MAAGESKEGGYDEILLAIVERLISMVEGCNKATCYISLDPDLLTSNPGTHVFVVAPNSGEFDGRAFVGGGLNMVTTHSGCIVKIHCPSLGDQVEQDAIALTSESLSVIRQASRVIAALCHTGDGPVPGAAWTPMRGEYDLTSPFTPVAYSLHRSENKAIRSIELAFRFEFDWDVTRQ